MFTKSIFNEDKEFQIKTWSKICVINFLRDFLFFWFLSLSADFFLKPIFVKWMNRFFAETGQKQTLVIYKEFSFSTCKKIMVIDSSITNYIGQGVKSLTPKDERRIRCSYTITIWGRGRWGEVRVCMRKYCITSCVGSNKKG